mgnify:CR=1 FL=1
MSYHLDSYNILLAIVICVVFAIAVSNWGINAWSKAKSTFDRSPTSLGIVNEPSLDLEETEIIIRNFGPSPIKDVSLPENWQVSVDGIFVPVLRVEDVDHDVLEIGDSMTLVVDTSIVTHYGEHTIKVYGPYGIEMIYKVRYFSSNP